MTTPDEDDKPRAPIWDMAIIGFALLLTLCAIGVCFFQFTVPAAKPQLSAPAASDEVTVGIPPKANP